MLKEIYIEVGKLDESVHTSSSNYITDGNYQRLLFLNVLYPDFSNKSAFDIAMEKKSPRSIEVMLDMLCSLP